MRKASLESSFPLSAVALLLFVVVQWCQTICFFASFHETTTRSIVAVTLPWGKPFASNLSAQTLLQMLHFTHLLSAPDVFWVHEDIPPPTLPPQHRASPIFYPDVLHDIWNAEWKRVAAHHVLFPSCDRWNHWIICLNFGEYGYKTEWQTQDLFFQVNVCPSWSASRLTLTVDGLFTWDFELSPLNPSHLFLATPHSMKQSTSRLLVLTCPGSKCASLINLDLTRNTGCVRFHSIKPDSSPITGSPAALDISFTPQHSSASHYYSHFLTCQRWNVAGGRCPPGSHSRQLQRRTVKTSCSMQRKPLMKCIIYYCKGSYGLCSHSQFCSLTI